ncbi:MAG TPA: flavodoxin-dependent (E)-4-hydroxy-3-methylbut-2-enyl-diphosphate synthase [Planctomycetota bacterium]|nr:flavodoxin-dependent (E)-4-hydroxy-3-methylbut-2-enyl-diphosphate synthase [Planctomycetota bacterium]
MLRTPSRRPTIQVPVGKLVLGSEQKVRVQSMTNTDTRDAAATIAQIRRLEEAGCELVRVTIPDKESAENIPAFLRAMDVPFIADIHFNHVMALAAIAQGAHKVRINPGNIGSEKKVAEVMTAARERGTAVRIGVNSGSLEKDLLDKHGWPSPEALAESAVRHVAFARKYGVEKIIVSIKSTDVQSAVAANELFGAQSDVPLHVGITEAGDVQYGSIKSAAGIGALLLKGIGDTIRVSLTSDPELEIPVAYDILKCTGVRVISPEIIACPTCGRIDIDLEKIVAEVKERTGKRTLPVKISVLGCAVNGPGEAKEADIGIAGGAGEGLLFRKGKVVRKVKESQIVDALIEELDAMEREAAAGATATAANAAPVAPPDPAAASAPKERAAR